MATAFTRLQGAPDKMPMDKQPNDLPPMLAYATPDIPAVVGDPLLISMCAWRRYTAWGLLACVAGLIVFPLSALVALVFVLFSSVMTLIGMARYAAHNVGRAYAIRHLVLAIILTPILFLGVFLVSRLVQADIERWLAADTNDTSKQR
jgi:hypothetical protein